MYWVLADSPVSEYVVAVEAVFATIVVNAPATIALSILYPVIGEPPLLADVHERLICDGDTAVAVSPVGADGTVSTVTVTIVE